MELVTGETLRDLIARGAIDSSHVVQLGRQLASALAVAHAAGVIHRDLKGANVMVSWDGGLKVLDFGIARRLAGSLETTYTAAAEDPGVAGTLPYMAPEVLRGAAATTRSDIWSLGVLLYEMITGRLPFHGATSAATAAAILHDPLPLLPSSIPPTIGHVITGCLDKDPSHRPASATEIVRALDVVDPVLQPRLSALSYRRRASAFATVVLLGVVTAAGSVAWLLRPNPGLNRPVSAIAVLPFDNLSGDPNQEFFSDGMTEQVITDLGRLKALHVIARGSVMHYKAHPKPPAAAAKELGVDALVDGSVLRVGDRVRVTAQLIAPDDGRVLWSDSFDRDASDILAMQAEIATTIARQVRATISPDEARSLAAAYSPNPKAHELYLQGRYHAYRKNPESAKKAVDYLVEATRLDSGIRTGVRIARRSISPARNLGWRAERIVRRPKPSGG
jgi:TolB-like protein